jgi:hypothetical protein
MKRKERDAFEDAVEFEDDMTEDSSEIIADDMDQAKSKDYASGMIPRDLFQYKRMRMQPEASTDFPGQIDKDWVLANMKGDKPNLQQKKFEVGTYLLIRNVFTKKAKVALTDKEGQPIIVNDKPVYYDGRVFDEAFTPVSEYVLSLIKSELVGSRGMGGDREAVLDITTGFRKQFERKKSQEGKMFGMGV